MPPPLTPPLTQTSENFQVGTLAHRLLDSNPFPCKILSHSPPNLFTVLYLDDNGVESDVHLSDLRVMNDSVKEVWRNVHGGRSGVVERAVRVARVGNEGFDNELFNGRGGEYKDGDNNNNCEDEEEDGEEKGGDNDCDDGNGNELFAKGNDMPKVTIHHSVSKDDNSSSAYSASTNKDPTTHSKQSSTVTGGEVIYENSSGSDGVFTIQGDTPLPRGGGLRGIRALRK